MEFDDKARRLHVAILDNDLPLVKKTIRSGAWVLSIDRFGKTALHWALVFGNRETTYSILKCISRGTTAGVNIADNNGCTALHYAAMEGRVDIAKMLLNRGARINDTDQEKMTALHYAAQTINPLMIHTLIRRKAEKLVLDRHNRLPYHVAVQWGGSNDVLTRLQPDNFEQILAQVDELSPQVDRVGGSKARDRRAASIEEIDGDLRKWVLSSKSYSSATVATLQRDRPISRVREEMIIEADAYRRQLNLMARLQPKSYSDDENDSHSAPSPAPPKLLSFFKACFTGEYTPKSFEGRSSSARHWVPRAGQIARTRVAEADRRDAVALPEVGKLPPATKSRTRATSTRGRSSSPTTPAMKSRAQATSTQERSSRPTTPATKKPSSSSKTTARPKARLG